MELLTRLLSAGWVSLLDYLAAHVLLCLLPAFLIAGYLGTMIPKSAITRYLGPSTSRWVSYPAAAVGGFVLAVCSCTILPLFAGIWRRGAGLGPAITFLFVGPAVNILAISYTGAAIGLDFALARVVLSILFGIAIGLLMARIFGGQADSQPKAETSAALFKGGNDAPPAVWVIFIILISVLIVGTLQIDWLTRSWITLELGFQLPARLISALTPLGLDPQGAVLIVLLLLIAPAAYLGLENVLERFSFWTWVALALSAMTLLTAAARITEDGQVFGLTGRFMGESALLLLAGATVYRKIGREDMAAWLWETWKFVKQIFPLLIVGVFAAGMAKVIIPETWVQSVAGRNTLWANAIGVTFGVFMYFPTLVEVPVARMFLELGMHRGPLLAYLLADPELSLQSILVTGRLLGSKRTAVYVVLVSFFSMAAGYMFGVFLALV